MDESLEITNNYIRIIIFVYHLKANWFMHKKNYSLKSKAEAKKMLANNERLKIQNVFRVASQR